ncbi:MAG: outer membrane lipoprotein chaperone LolA [Bacteroidota bacterium]
MKRTSLRLILICLSTALAFHAFAGEDLSAGDVLKRLQKRYEGIVDARVEFFQSTNFSLSRVQQTSEGTVYMKKGSKYRVQTEQQTIVTDGKTVWSYSPVTNQVLIDHYVETPRSFSPEKFLFRAPTDYSATLLRKQKLSSGMSYVLKLVPKSDDSFIQSLKLWVEDKTWLIRRVELLDQNETETSYEVRDIVINPGIDDGKFRLDVPAGVEVVDMRSHPQ